MGSRADLLQRFRESWHAKCRGLALVARSVAEGPVVKEKRGVAELGAAARAQGAATMEVWLALGARTPQSPQCKDTGVGWRSVGTRW